MAELSTLEHQIQDAAKEFARGEFDRERLSNMSKAGAFPDDLFKKACDTGFMGIHLPGEYGGGDGAMAEQAIVIEEFAGHDSTAGFALASPLFGLECIEHFGDRTIKQEIIPAVLAGKALCAPAFYEKDVQAVAPAFECRAEQTDSGWLINGTKTNVLNGDRADYLIVACSTGDGPAAGESTMFLVDKCTRGMTVTNQGARLGLEMVPSSTVCFENVRIPSSRVIGKQGAAMDQLRAFYCAHWILLAALGVGMAKGAYKRSLDYIRKRKQFGRPLAAFGVNRNKTAAMTIRIKLADLAVRNAARAYDAGRRQEAVSALARLSATGAAVEVCDEAVQLMGGYGYMAEYEVEHFLRDAKTLDLLAGEKAMLMDMISEQEIGRC